MAASKIRIKKTCEWCGQEFYAQKITTRFCCKRCSEKSYKAGLRTAQIEQATNMLESRPQEEVSKMEYLSVRKAAVLLGLPLRTTYDLIYSGKLKACKISSRLTLIRRCDIEEMVNGGSYNKSTKGPHSIPKKKVKREVFYSKAHVDIAKGLVEPEKPQYYTMKEAMEKFGMTRDQLYHYVKVFGIPKHMEGKYVKYSRKEMDAAFSAPKL